MANGTNLGTAYGYIEIRDNIDDAADKAQRSFGNAIRDMTGKLESLGAKMTEVGAKLTILTAPLVLAMKKGVDAALEFDEMLRNIQSVTGDTDEEVKTLRDNIMSMAQQSRFGPQAIAESMYDIAGGVADASTHMAILQAAVATAEAGNSDLGGTTSALISIMNSYSYAADQAGFASDVLTKTVGMGVGTMDEFAAALPAVAGMAAANGVEFDNLAGSMAWLTTKGNTPAEAATQLAGIMSALLNPNEKMKDAFEQMGWESGQAALEMYGLAGVTGRLQNEFGQVELAPMLGNLNALRGVIGLNDAAFEEFIGTFYDTADGATEAARAIQNMSRKAKLAKFQSQIEVLAITFGETLFPAIEALMEKFTPIIEAITKWIEENPELVGQIATLVAGIAALGAALTVGGMAVSALGGLLAALLSPIGLIIGGAILLGTVFQDQVGAIIDAITPAFGTFTDVVNEGGTVIDGVVAAVAGAFGNLAVASGLIDGEDFVTFRNSVEGTLGGVATFVKDTVTIAFETLRDLLSGFWTAVQPGLNRLFNWIMTDALPTAVGFLNGPVKSAFNGFVKIVADIWRLVEPGLVQLFDWFTSTGLPEISSFIRDTVQPAIDDFINGLLGIWEQVQPGLQSLANWFTTDVLPGVEQFITGTVMPAIRGFVNILRTIWNDVSPFLGQLANWFLVDALPRVNTFIKTVIQPVLEGLVSLISGIWEAVRPALESLYNWFVTEGLPGVVNFLETTVIPVIDGIISTLSGIWTAVQPGVQALADGIRPVFNLIANTIIPWVLDKIQSLIDIIGTIWETARPFVEAFRDGLNTVFSFIRDNIIQPVVDAINSIPTALQNVLDQLNIFDDIVGGMFGMTPGQGLEGYGSSPPSRRGDPLSNLPGFGGFATGGYTGDGPANAVAGLVHNQEFVVPRGGALVMGGGGRKFAEQVNIYANDRAGGIAAADAFESEMMFELRAMGRN